MCVSPPLRHCGQLRTSACSRHTTRTRLRRVTARRCNAHTTEYHLLQKKTSIMIHLLFDELIKTYLQRQSGGQVRCRANNCVMIYSRNIFKRQSLLKVAGDSYPPSTKAKRLRKDSLKTKRKYPHLCRDASVSSVPQTHTRGRLHLVGGSPRRLVALPVRPHLQVLMDDIWSRDGKKNRVRG